MPGAAAVVATLVSIALANVENTVTLDESNDNVIVLVGSVMVEQEDGVGIKTPAFFVSGNATARFPGEPRNTTTFELYRSTINEITVNSTAVNSTAAIIPIESLPMTVLYDFYHRHHLFLGPPPREYMMHIVSLGCAVPKYPVDPLAQQHRLPNRTLCGEPVFDRYIDCDGDSAVIGVVTTPVLSAKQLGIGVHLTQPHCFYAPAKHDVDRTSSWLMIIQCVSALVLCVHVTVPLAIDTAHEQARRMLAQLTTEFYNINAMLVFAIWNGALYSIAIDNHAMYGIAVVRASSVRVVRVTAAVGGCGMLSVVGATAMVVMAYGRAVLTLAPAGPPPVWGSWGSRVGRHYPVWKRLAGMVAAVVVVGVGAWGAWALFLGHPDSAVIMTMPAIVTVVHLSSPGWVEHIIRKSRAQWISPVAAVHVTRLTIEYMSFVGILFNIPHDSNGVLITRTRTLVLAVIGVILVVTTARDVAVCVSLYPCSVWRHAAHPIAACTIWIAVVFSTGPLFVLSGELADHGSVAILVGTALTVLLYAVAFLASIAPCPTRKTTHNTD